MVLRLMLLEIMARLLCMTAALFNNSNPDVVKALISAGAKVNAKTKDGLTPLHLAAYNNSNPDVVKALISAGAKVNAQVIIEARQMHNENSTPTNSNPDVVKSFRMLNDKDENINQSTINLLARHAIKKMKTRNEIWNEEWKENV